MKRIHPVYREMQIVRAKHGWTQGDTAEALGLSAPHLSRIEHGRQQVPDTFLDDVSRAMKLCPRDKLKLADAIDQSRTTLKIGDIEPGKRIEIARLMSHVRTLSREEIEALNREIGVVDIRGLELSNNASHQATLSRHPTQLAAPMSFLETAKEAAELRYQTGTENEMPLNFMRFFEHRVEEVIEDFTFSVEERASMKDCSAITYPQLRHIAVAENIYQAARRGGVGCQYILAHELGHLWLHEAISPIPAENAHNYPRYYHAEHQANKFAQNILAPPWMIEDTDDAASLAKRMRVSEMVARIQIKDCKRVGLSLIHI